MSEKYEVIHTFKDLKDNEHIYNANKDLYPREGLKPTKKRIEELSTINNKIGEVLIQKVQDETKTEE